MNKFIQRFGLAALLMFPLSFQTTAQVKPKPKAPVKKTVTATPQSAAPITVTEPWKQINSKERLVEISTNYGVMIAKLYDSTPLHRDNFIKLVQQKFYDSLLFHRVISQFMIQGGDPASKDAADGVPLGGGSAPGDRIPAEFKSALIHKKGVLAAARENNPERASSNCQFYIVHGKVMQEAELENVYNQRVKPSNPAFSYTKTQKEIYKRVGGTPFLDQNYSVFGEVISGLDVIDKIAGVAKDGADRPTQNVRMKIRLLN